MKATIEKKEKNVVSFKVEVPCEEVDKDIDRAYKSLSHKLKIPGFRKGKIPNSIIDSRIGKDGVYAEYVDLMLPELYREAITQMVLKVIDIPKIKVDEIGEGKPLIFSGSVEVLPEVKLGEYKNMSIATREIKITAKEINNQLELLRNKFAVLEPFEADSLKSGYFALSDIEGIMEGKKIGKLSRTDFLIEVGSGKMGKYFEDKIVGMKKGEEKNIELTYPDEYIYEDMAGKTVNYKVTLKDIKRKVLPHLDDDFAKQMGIETLKELKANIKKRLLSAKEMQREALKKREVVEKVSNNTQVEIPKKIEERYRENERENFEHRLKKEGLSLEQYLGMMKISEEDLDEQFKKNAQASIKTELVLEAIGNKEGIEVTKEELDKKIESAIEKGGKEKAKLERLFANEENRELVRKEMLGDKIIDFLLKNAKITMETPLKAGEEKETDLPSNLQAKMGVKSNEVQTEKKKNLNKGEEKK